MYDGVKVDSIHAHQPPLQRELAVANFRAGRTWVLVSTDLLGRGMDFVAVNMVINYDLPRCVRLPKIASKVCFGLKVACMLIYAVFYSTILSDDVVGPCFRCIHNIQLCVGLNGAICVVMHVMYHVGILQIFKYLCKSILITITIVQQ